MSQKVQSPSTAGGEDPRTSSVMVSAPEPVRNLNSHFCGSFSRGITAPALNHCTRWALCLVVV